MIKSLIILALLIALLGGAALSRPSEDSFREMTTKKMQADGAGGGFLDKILLQSKIDSYLDDCTYTNRILWATIEKDGQVIYTGAFSKWFDRTGK